MKKSTLTLLIVASLLVIAILYVSRGPDPVYCKYHYAQREQPVVMFSTNWCGYCKRARRLFIENKVAFCEYNIEHSDQNYADYLKLGGVGVPLIVIGEEILYGFDKTQTLSTLNELALINSAQSNPRKQD